MPDVQTESRALLVAPTPADAEAGLRMLDEAGIHGLACVDVAALNAEIRRGAGVVILTDLSVHSAESLAPLEDTIRAQPAWSELPIVVLAGSGRNADASANLRNLPGVVLLERPAYARTLLSAVQAALRARQRQYQIREQLERIRVSNDQLAQAAEAKDRFLATLAHELRNPLSALSGAVRLLKITEPQQGPEKVAREIITRQLGQMTRLLDDLLDVARITRNRLELRRRRTRLSEIVQAAIETAQPAISARQHQLEVVMPENEVVLDVDPMRISQVVSNLLTNAAKYTEPHGHIRLQAWCEDSEAVVTVRDNGMGIAPDALGSIFGMFTQLENGLQRSDGGLGIGLSLARRLVELHGGSIDANSAGVPGQGSEFVVRVPLGSVDLAQPLDLHDPDVDTPAASRSIVVADDNADSLDALAQLLRLQGHVVHEARDGAEAVALAQQQHPDVVLLDIGMPRLNGYEAARQLRASSGGGQMKLIALSGWGQSSDKKAAREAGFDHHLTKPVDIDALGALLG